MSLEEQCPSSMAHEDSVLDDFDMFGDPSRIQNISDNITTTESIIPTITISGYKGAAETFYYAISGVILILCALLATLGNGAIVAVVIRKGLPQTVTHLLVVNLAVAHLLLSLTCTPLDAGYLLTAGRWLTDNHGCRFQRFAETTFTSAAILTLSTIAVDRYYSVVYPLEQKITMYKGKLMIIYVWCHAVIISLPKAIVCEVNVSPRGRLICNEHWHYLTQAKVYLISYTTLTMFGPLILTSTSYCLVWRAFRVSQRRVNVMNTLRRPKTVSYLPYASKTEIRLLKMLFFMVFCFVVLWSPVVVNWFLKYFNPDLVVSEYFILTSQWFCRIQPVLDPIIYGYLNKQFRKSLRDMLRVCSQCSLYYSNDIKMSTASENNTPISSDQYDDEFSQGAGQFDEDENIGNGCSWMCARSNAVVDTAVQPAVGIDPVTLKAPSSSIPDKSAPIPNNVPRAYTAATVNSKEAPAGSISYISKTDPPQRRASLTYHISGSVKLLPDTRDNEDSVTNRPKAPVWYLGGTFPLNSNPIRNISRLAAIESQDSHIRPPLQRQNALRPLDGEDMDETSYQPNGNERTGLKKKRKRKKILSKRIDAKKCYSSGGVYLGPP